MAISTAPFALSYSDNYFFLQKMIMNRKNIFTFHKHENRPIVLDGALGSEKFTDTELFEDLTMANYIEFVQKNIFYIGLR